LSHHFNILKAADLVRTERRGQHIVYSLNATVLQETIAMMMNMFSYDDSMPRNDDEKRRNSE
jgi:DNA-binding transcriptional ArsR family regulator